ncbi:MAG: MBL fold metallo-hydrolase [Cyclobacteriaceae bacterium]|nr:MBL fold metallo-hydrolase [Cyclobacteriaceae bacterium]
MQVLNNIFQVGGDINGLTFDEPGALWNDGNSYVIQTDQGLIMIDCGCGDTMEQIFDNMLYWGLDPEDLHYCVLTHPHFDHAAGGHLLKKRGVLFVSIAETADAVSTGDERCCGYLYHKKFVPFTVDRIVKDGERFELCGITFTAMHLPGHSMGCTAYFLNWENRRLVFSGDVIGTLLAGDFGWSGSIDFNKPVYIKSLQKFAREDTDIMLPGHGMIYFYKPRRRVEEALNSALMQWR